MGDTQVKFEAKAMKPQDFAFEVTHTQGPATFGLKCDMANLQAPDLGVRFTQGPLFVSLLAKEKLNAFTAHTFYKASDQLQIAGTYQQGGKNNGSFAAGIAYDMGGCQGQGKGNTR